ncbi:MAG: YdbC family protein [Spirochaetaceae bacterium]|nr:YdbC family protein [Spirochaetaceae bacterium]MBR3812315.1 YdbC family protein [Spirochaetaceae bacterium]
MADDFTFKITESFGVLSESKAGWKTELNMVSWGDRPAKYDIRSWSPDHQKMGKGVTMTKEELSALKSLLNTLDV